MAYVIAAPCVDVKDRSCIEVCPVDCIYEYDPEQDGFGVPNVDAMGSGQKDKVVLRSGVAHSRPADFAVELAQRQLFIHPEECIDCGACEPACPVEAIFAEADVPAEWQEFIQINLDAFKV
jgi:NAD-dependent dihydropyrimidine dehydrogenase PreA subunit